jgi:hypothetical protein
MARGKSGRIVIEVDGELKRQLYIVLAAKALTLKDWFVQQAKEFIEEHHQPRLLPNSPPTGRQQR